MKKVPSSERQPYLSPVMIREVSPKHAPMRTSGRLRWERIKRWMVGLAAVILLAALQTTLFARIRLPLLPSASPSLTLLLTIAAGFFLGEREGAVAGLMAGFFAEASTGEGIMLLPLLYTLCGYFIGVLTKNHLGRNLPSFMVWVTVAGIWEQALRYVVAGIIAKTVPPAAMLTQDLFPHLILTLLFAPAIYGIAKLTTKLFDRS